MESFSFYQTIQYYCHRPLGGWRVGAMRALVRVTEPLYCKLSRGKTPPWSLSVKELAQFPKGSLANELAVFLTQHNLSLIPQLESHDVFHILLGYHLSVLDEARMQFCLVGSGRRSVYSVGTCMVAAIIFPEYRADFIRHYNRGKGMANFSYWDFKALLAHDFEKLCHAIKSERA